MIDKVPPNPSPGYTNEINRLEGKPDLTRPNIQSSSAAQLSLSGDALALQRIMQTVKDTPDVRLDVVEAIRGQLEAGVYQVNVESLAEKLLPLLK